MITISVILGI